MEYFYTTPSRVAPDHLVIEGDEFSHLTHVMRKKIGDPVRVVDGVGHAYDVSITSIERRTARCRILDTHSRLHEPDLDVTLAVALLKNASKFDFLVEKTTELGVSSIVPVLTERTIPHHAKIERWQKLALAAMKQSCRCVLPKVHQLVSFDDFVTRSDKAASTFILHESAEMPIRTRLSTSAHARKSSIVLCIGPEGGFSDKEVDYASQAGFVPTSLGARRLRTETAAIVSVALVLS